MPYEIAVSSGLSIEAAAPPELKLGLGYKILSITTYGVNFVQGDLQSPAELTQPNVMDQIKQAVDTLNIKYSLHGEINEFVAWDTASEQLWRISHDRLHTYLDNFWEMFIFDGNQKYRPKFIDFHASHADPIGIYPLAFRMRTNVNVDPWGRSDFTNLWETPDGEETLPDLKNWFKKNLLEIILPFDTFAILFSNMLAIKPEFIERIKTKLGPELFGVLTEERRGGLLKLFQQYTDKALDLMYETWLEYSRERISRGSVETEEAAYVIIAKYMELKKDDPEEPVWRTFFENASLDDKMKEWNVHKESRRPMIDQKGGKIDLTGVPELIAAVSTRYVLGHFQADPPPNLVNEKRRVWKVRHPEKSFSEVEDFFKKNGFQKMEEIEIPIVFENPELSQFFTPGRQRIIHLKHIFNLTKALNGYSQTIGLSEKNFRILIDFEHYVHNGLDPRDEINEANSDVGEYVLACHVYSPTPTHIHLPIDVGSEDQRKIYRWLHMLRQKNFKDGVLIFERGGGQQPGEYIKTSILALRLITEFLEKDTDPEKLPPEFFGAAPREFYSPERQIAIIREHARDPLKGTMLVPEEGYGFLSTAIIQGKAGKKPEEWKKEELR